jgi:hypothetical protein
MRGAMRNYAYTLGNRFSGLQEQRGAQSAAKIQPHRSLIKKMLFSDVEGQVEVVARSGGDGIGGTTRRQPPRISSR